MNFFVLLDIDEDSLLTLAEILLSKTTNRQRSLINNLVVITRAPAF